MLWKPYRERKLEAAYHTSDLDAGGTRKKDKIHGGGHEGDDDRFKEGHHPRVAY